MTHAGASIWRCPACRFILASDVAIIASAIALGAWLL